MPLQILIKIISRQKSSQEFWEGKIAEAEEIRHASDYDDFYIATREEVEEQIDTAVELVEKNRRIRLERDGIIVFVSFMKYLWRFLKSKMHCGYWKILIYINIDL